MSKGSGSGRLPNKKNVAAANKRQQVKAALSAALKTTPQPQTSPQQQVQALLSKFDRSAYYKQDPKNNNTVVGYLSKAMGGDTPPQVVTETKFNSMEDNGAFQYVGYRTVGNAAQIEQFKTGAHSFDGRGIYGSGHYIAVAAASDIRAQRIAKVNSLCYGQRKDAMRIGIPKTAKIGDYGTLYKQCKRPSDVPVLALKQGLDGYVIKRGRTCDYFVLINRKVAVVDNSLHN